MVQRGYFRHSVLFDPFGEGYRLENRRRSTLVDKLRMHAAAMTTSTLHW